MQMYISGSMAFDRIMTFPGKFADHILPDKIHILNVCFLVDGMDEKFGGTAGNIAYTLSLLGEKPTVLSCVGKDFDRYADWMKRHGLTMDGIRTVDEEFTAGAYITTDKSDNQITGFNPGAMKYACGYDFGGVDAADSLAIVSPGNIDDMVNLPKYYKDKGIRYIFDPGQQIPVFTPEQMLECIDGSYMLFTNDYELQMIMNNTGKSREEIGRMTEIVVTTLGEKGSLISNNGDTIEAGIARANVVADPTGAGDAFRAGFMKGLAEGDSLEECARLGAVCSSFCVEKKGTQEHAFTTDQFEERYRANFA